MERVEIGKNGCLPIGYWHGFPRSLSGIGEILIKSRSARVLGRVQWIWWWLTQANRL